MKDDKNQTDRSDSGVRLEAGVIKPTQFVELDFNCDNCGERVKIKLKTNEYGDYNIDPPYFCEECDKLIDEAL